MQDIQSSATTITNRRRGRRAHNAMRRITLTVPSAVADQLTEWAAQLECDRGAALAQVLEALQEAGLELDFRGEDTAPAPAESSLQ